MSTALYRRYRPDTFEDVIGQRHVTDALQAALASGRIAHAFLFSGPRGCGKTTSARILARCLNCAQGPTPTPCGVCQSCVELASGGPGSLDVVEIDAASHSSVNDTRELRDKVSLAPVRDRYRVFILDEAHMVSAQGFNALLKVVEEPPEHVKFIFATTDPDKVINTIRSRTHHYPFRLVAPAVLVPYLRQVTEQENIRVDDGVYPLVVRSGGGSVRDSLSVLDQLIAGSDGHVTTSEAVALLGYTDSSLLERTVDALGTNDGAAVFRIIDEVMAAGHEPRRFVEDLLQRLRDLVVCALAGERAATILADIPEDQLLVMHTQATRWGTKLLSRRADIVEAALREMSGATAPRLQLELLMARLLVSEPAAAQSEPAPPPVTSAPKVTVPAPDGGPSRPTPSSEPTSVLQTPHAGPVDRQGGEAEVVAPTEVGPGLDSQRGSSEASSSRGRDDSDGPDHPAVAPDQDFLRSNWNELLSRLDQRGSVFRNLMRNMGGAASRGNVTFVFFKEAPVAAQFQRFEGERHLGEILGEMVARPVSVCAAPLEQKRELLLGETAQPEPPAPADAENASPDSEVPEEAQTALTPQSVDITEGSADPSLGDGAYRGRPAVDVFLDIVGGSVIEEKIIEPQSVPPAAPEHDYAEDVPPEFDLEDR